MPIDWHQIDVASIAAQAAADADEKLVSQLSSLSRMTDQEIQSLLPNQSELENFTELMKIVKSATAMNQKTQRIIENSERFAEVIVKLLDKLV